MGIRSTLGGLARALARAGIRALGPRSGAEVVSTAAEEMVHVAPTPAGELRFLASSPLLLDRALGALAKEPDTIAWIDSFAEGSVMWDIGANVGVYSLYAAARRCKVLAFEPSASNFFVLSRNVELNRLAGSVSAYCVALSGKTGLGFMNLSSPSPGMAMNQFGPKGESSPYWEGAPGGAHGMVGFTVDEFVARFAPAFPNHVKLDVDGLELAILEGAVATLSDLRVLSVSAELAVNDSGQRDAAIRLLAGCGLRLASTGAVQGEGALKAANHRFERHR